MSLITLAIYLSALFVLITGMIALLPDGQDYPYPSQVETGIETIMAFLFNFDLIFPVTEFFTVMRLAVAIIFITRFIWPSAVAIFNMVTRKTG